MKKIGEGWQYTVCDLENGRVLKKPQSFWHGHWIIFRDTFPYTRHRLWKVPGYRERMDKIARTSIRGLESISYDPVLLGNPKFFEDDTSYEQDNVVSLHKYIMLANLRERENVIQRFISCNKQLIKFGFIDKSFNITKNFGMNGDGIVILTDLGELIFGKRRIDERIKNKPWYAHYVVRPLPKDIREYFVREMDKAF